MVCMIVYDLAKKWLKTTAIVSSRQNNKIDKSSLSLNLSYFLL